MTAKVGTGVDAAALLAVATSVASHRDVTTTDIQRLQDQVYQASTDVSRLRATDQPQRVAARRRSSTICATRSCT